MLICAIETAREASLDAAREIKIGVNKKLQKEQAGFRSMRIMTEQIFILRNILEQANEWRSGLCTLYELSLKRFWKGFEKACGISLL